MKFGRATRMITMNPTSSASLTSIRITYQLALPIMIIKNQIKILFSIWEILNPKTRWETVVALEYGANQTVLLVISKKRVLRSLLEKISQEPFRATNGKSTKSPQLSTCSPLQLYMENS